MLRKHSVLHVFLIAAIPYFFTHFLKFDLDETLGHFSGHLGPQRVHIFRVILKIHARFY